MKQIAIILVVILAATLILLPSATWAWGNRSFVAVRSGHVSVFISSGQPFVHQHFFSPHFVHHHFGSPVIITTPVIVVNPAPQPVWVQGSWWWNGFQWVWIPGYWFFPQ